MLLGIQDANAADISANPVLATSYTYTGREYDFESGFYYYRARYYSSQLGRFLQRDPDPGNSGVPITVINAYVYSGNNAANLVDPSGMKFRGLGWLNSTVDRFVTDKIGSWAWIVALPIKLDGIQGKMLLANPTIDKTATAAAIITAAAFTGGAAAGAWAGGSAAAGALIGAGVGAAIGAAGYAVTDVAPWWHGAIAGAIAGGIAGYNASGSNGRSPAANKWEAGYDKPGQTTAMTEISRSGYSLGACIEFGAVIGGVWTAGALFAIGAPWIQVSAEVMGPAVGVAATFVCTIL